MKYVVEDSVLFMINRTLLKMKKELLNGFKDYDITTEQWALLTRLFKDDGISQTQLAIRTNKDLPCITRMLDKMEKKELIQRKPDLNDSRAYLIFLTEKGRELEDKLDPIALEMENKGLKDFTKEDIQLLKKLLKNVLDNLD